MIRLERLLRNERFDVPFCSYYNNAIDEFWDKHYPKELFDGSRFSLACKGGQIHRWSRMRLYD